MTDLGPVDTGPDAAEQGGQQGQHDDGADQRDEHAAEPHAPRNGTGITSSATRLIATVPALDTTARPAVCMATVTASSFDIPVVAFLAPSGDEEQGVVDGDTETTRAIRNWTMKLMSVT